jgi:hypothetical protein
LPPEPSATVTPATAIYCVLWILVLCLSIFSVRERHPRQVYGVWYSFSLALCFSSVVFFSNPSYFERIFRLTDNPSDGWLQRTVIFFLRSLVDEKGEISLIAAAMAIVVLPQQLSYFLSGIFGCAATPIPTRKISGIAMLSFIKFFAVYSGITLGSVLFIIWTRPSDIPLSYTVTTSVGALAMLATSFAIIVFYHAGERLDLFLDTNPRFRGFARYISRFHEKSEHAER